MNDVIISGLFQRRENNPIWNEFFELEFDDLEDGKVMVVLLDEAAPQEFQVLGYCQFFLQVITSLLSAYPPLEYNLKEISLLFSKSF